METLVSYAYYESDIQRYAENLSFFLEQGVVPYLEQYPYVTYLFVIQGHTCSVQIPKHDRIHVLYTDNSGYDLGAHGKGLAHLKTQGFNLHNFQYFMFLNSGQRGPFLPVYWPTDQHWTHAFINQIHKQEKPGAVSASMFLHRVHDVPIVETWCFCLGADTFHDVYQNTTTFDDHKTKLDVIHNGEEALSIYLNQQDYSVGCLLYKYKHMDWTESTPDKCLQNGFPSRPWQYADINVNPMETLFYKCFWRSLDEEDNNNYECPFEQRYTAWDRKESKENLPVIQLRPAHVKLDHDSFKRRLKDPVFIGMVVASVLAGGFLLWALWATFLKS